MRLRFWSVLLMASAGVGCGDSESNTPITPPGQDSGTSDALTQDAAATDTAWSEDSAPDDSMPEDDTGSPDHTLPDGTADQASPEDAELETDSLPEDDAGTDTLPEDAGLDTLDGAGREDGSPDGSHDGSLSPDTDVPDTSSPAPAIYVSTTGDDTAPGTFEEPVQTFSHALSIRKAEEEIRVFDGVYTEPLRIDEGGTVDFPLRVLPVAGSRPILQGSPERPVDLSGSFIVVEGFEVTGSENQCVDVTGSDIVLRDLVVHGSMSHGVSLHGSRILVEGCEVFENVLENEGEQGAWGSALKVSMGGQDITLRRNHVYHNWGEGIAVTRGVDVRVEQNWSHDNYAVNIYIDNSNGVVVDGNLSTCVPVSGYEREGEAAVGIALGEEYYDGWGAQRHHVTIQNNIAVFCRRGLSVWESDVGGSLGNVTVVHNTFWGSTDTAVSFDPNPVSGPILLANNLVEQPDGKTVYIDDPSGIERANNFWVNGTPEDWRNGSGPGDRSGDPTLYVTPDRTVCSYRLGEGSSARDGSMILTSPTTDIEGRPRYTDDSPGADMGAMEFGDPTQPCHLTWPE